MMFRDTLKLGLVTVVGLGVVATVGVGVGVATLVAGVIIAGVSSADLPRDDTTGTPYEGNRTKAEEKKIPKRPTSPHVFPQEKRPSQATRKQSTTDISSEAKSGRSPQTKSSAPIGKEERGSPTPTSTNAESQSDRKAEGNYSAPIGKDERKPSTPTPNRQRSSSVVVNNAPPSSSKEDAPHGNGTVLPGGKPSSSLSRELESQVATEIKHWRKEKPSNQETWKRGTAASGHGISEKPSSTELAPKAETMSESKPVVISVNTPGPLPLLPPSPASNSTYTPHLNEATLESNSEPEMTATVPIKDEKPTLSQNVKSQELSVLTPEDLHVPKSDVSPPSQAELAQEPLSEAPVSLQERHPDSPPFSTTPVVSAPIEELADLGADAATASTLLTKLEAEPMDTFSIPVANSVALGGPGVLQGPASASRDSLVSVQRRNSKLASAAKKVSHSVRKVFKGPDGKVIHSDPQRLTSSSSDSVDSQRFIVDHEQGLLNSRVYSKLASSSRESVASTKSRRSLMDGTKKGFKRMFRGSSDNIEIPPVPPLPNLTSTFPEPAISNEKIAIVPSASTPTPKKFMGSSKNALPNQQHHQQPHAVSNTLQSTRNAPGAPDAGNNASPLLKGMFKGRRVRR